MSYDAYQMRPGQGRDYARQQRQQRSYQLSVSSTSLSLCYSHFCYNLGLAVGYALPGPQPWRDLAGSMRVALQVGETDFDLICFLGRIGSSSRSSTSACLLTPLTTLAKLTTFYT